MKIEFEFQKRVLLVMLIIVAMQACFYLLSNFTENEIKVKKEFILENILGVDFLDCMKSIHLREKNLDAEEYKNNPQLKKVQNEINLINTASVIVAIGLLYLFSCIIVRLMMKIKFNIGVEQTPSK